MPAPDLIYKNSRFFENLQEHRFLYDLATHLVLREPPQLLNILKAEVDMFGFDLVLSLGEQTRHLQMKTWSGAPPSNSYEISETIWTIPGGCVVWVLYSQTTLQPTGYYLFGFPVPALDTFSPADRLGYRNVKMQSANHQRLSIGQLADVLFPTMA